MPSDNNCFDNSINYFDNHLTKERSNEMYKTVPMYIS